MSNTVVVIEKIVAMFLVILMGWAARRRGYVEANTTRILSGFTTDIALPALIFTQMLESVNRQVLRESWLVPVMAAAALLLGQVLAWASWRLFCTRREAPTFIFVVTIANWIYLPLPIVQSLYGSDGVRVLLLCNAGVQIVLWTVGVATLHGGRLDRAALITLATNPGLIATFAGIAVALIGVERLGGGLGWTWHLAGRSLFQGMAMIGSLTIPLSLLVTGAQLGGMTLAASKPTTALGGVVILRLFVVPLVALAAIWGLQQTTWVVPRMHLSIAYLISAMPVAVSCSILAERFGQDTKLAAQSILYTTLLSLATVPLMFWVFNRMMG